MLNPWFSSKSSRRRNSPRTRNDAHLGPSDTSSVSQSTVEPIQIPGNLTSASDIPLEEVHAHINDPSTYAPAPSLIQSVEKDVGTVRTSDPPASSLGATEYQPEHDTTSHIPERPNGTLFTPQDAILAQVFGKLAPPTTVDSQVHDILPPAPSSGAPQPSVSQTTADSAFTPASASVPLGPAWTVYEPFSGARLSEHPTSSASPSIATPRAHTTPVPAADDRRLWASLERILELQAEIAAIHADMEGVGKGPGGDTHIVQAIIANVGAGKGSSDRAGPRKRSKRGQTLLVGDEEPEEHEPEAEVPLPGVTTSELSSEHSGEEDDDDDDGIHTYGKRRRDEEFAKLAEQFAQRKTAIGGIMNKLDALSTALKTFHTIPPPLFDLAVSPHRSDTVSSSGSPAPSPPPPHVHSGRASSFSSVSPSQAMHPMTSPMIPLPPPVPPISTLAPPWSPGDPNAPAPVAVVAPVLPKMAFPTIIPGAPHVDSPSDIDQAQSVFQKVR